MPISEFQFQEMLRRTNPRAPVVDGGGGKNRKKESELHAEIIEECKRRGWLYFHGSMAHETYRTLGEPDFQIWADGGRKFAFECKRRGGKLSTAQLGVIAWAQKLGHTIHVITTLEEFLEIVK